MKFLSPTDYLHWPSFAQRICFSYNAVPHDTLGHISPFEMDCGTFPVSAFAPPLPYDASDPTPADEDSQQLITPPPIVSPAWAAEAIRVSVAAFHRFALAHTTYMQRTTQERLNKQGTPTSFQLNDRVKIYVPPTHAQLLRTSRRAKHIIA